MANEKGQGAKGADIQNTNAAYTLMASGAFEDVRREHLRYGQMVASLPLVE